MFRRRGKKTAEGGGKGGRGGGEERGGGQKKPKRCPPKPLNGSSGISCWMMGSPHWRGGGVEVVFRGF